MTQPPQRKRTSRAEDIRGGIRSIGLEALVVIVLVAIGLLVAWIAVTVV